MSNPAYDTYWKRKALRKQVPQEFPVVRWWEVGEQQLSEVEQLLFGAVRAAGSLLDVGAGDLRVMRKLQAAGFAGDYHTQDIGTEFPYTYTDLSQVNRTYGAVMCLDVMEHLPLADGLRLLNRMMDLVAPGGSLVLQTANARCIRNPMSWDMTHVQLYSLPDLWAYVRAAGLEADGYRVWFSLPRLHWREAIIARVRKYLITRFLLMDYAENIVLLARKPPA
jgi:hypothetical protein